jgi:hypothetical protein
LKFVASVAQLSFDLAALTDGFFFGFEKYFLLASFRFRQDASSFSFRCGGTAILDSLLYPGAAENPSNQSNEANGYNE